MFGISFRKPTAEEQLIQRVCNGDSTAAEQLYNQNVRYLSAVCSRYIGFDEDVKDVLQEAFLKIFASIGDFEYRGEGSLRGWMARITVNETLKFLRARNRLETVDIDDANIDIADSDIKSEDIPTEILHRFISELPDGYRTVFNLYVVEDMSHKDISSVLGIKESTSASQLHKAKAMLARRIKQYRTTNSI